MPALLKQLGSRRQAILLGVLAVVLCLALVRWRPGGGAAAPPPRRNRRRAGRGAAPTLGGDSAGDELRLRRGRRRGAKEVNPDDVPVISVADLAPAAPSGRIPTRAATSSSCASRRARRRRRATPPPPAPGDVRFVGPLPPPPPTPTPAPPEIAFKFIGTFGPKDHPIAVVQQGDQVLQRPHGRHALRQVHPAEGGLRVDRRRFRGIPGGRDPAAGDHAMSRAPRSSIGRGRDRC